MEHTATHSRTLFIGDVHGMLETLDELLKTVELRASDRLVFLGDLIDKGPDPVGVVRRVAELQARSDIQTFVVRGNHEDKHIRFYNNLSKRPQIAQNQSRTSKELTEFHQEATDADWETLLNTLAFLRLDDLDILAVHGGIPGNMYVFPKTHEEALSLVGKDKSRFEKVWRTRYIDNKTGAFVALRDQKPGDPFWAETYDGRFGHVVFGHHAELSGPALHPHATGLDTGAVYGGKLTAMVCSDRSDRTFVSVPGRAYSVHFDDL